MIKSETIKELAVAFTKAQGEFPKVAFDSVNPHFRNKFASLSAIDTATKGVLAKHGLAVTQILGCDGQNYFLETLLLHSSGEYLGSLLPLILSKNDMQQLGASTKYARRYAKAAILGLVDDEDTDGNDTVDLPKKPPVTQKPPPAAARPAMPNAAFSGLHPNCDKCKKIMIISKHTPNAFYCLECKVTKPMQAQNAAH